MNFANGFLDEDLNLQLHHPDHGATYVLPYRYLPEAAGEFPRFQRFMNDSWGHDPDFQQKMDVFQEIIGATIFGVAPRYQKAFCFFGAAGSGKSVASEILREMLPAGTCSSIPPEKWNDQFLPAEMYGKVLNFAGELSDHKKIPGEIFKQIVEGGIITTRTLYQKPFEFRPVCAQQFNSNHLPKTSDTSAGFNRRWLFLEWNRKVPEVQRIPELAKIISLAEREAITAWAALGFKRLSREGRFTEPSSHTALVNRMAAENNSVRYFLTASPDILVGQQNTSGKTSDVDLYDKYWTFCIAYDVPRREPRTKFSEMMRSLTDEFDFKIEDQTKGGMVVETMYVGIETETTGLFRLRVAAE